MRVSRASWFRGLVEKLFGRNTHTTYARRRKRPVMQRALTFETCEARQLLASDLAPASPWQNKSEQEKLQSLYFAYHPLTMPQY